MQQDCGIFNKKERVKRTCLTVEGQIGGKHLPFGPGCRMVEAPRGTTTIATAKDGLHMENKKTFGAYICRCRKGLGLTQKEFADKLFVTESAVSKWERGALLPGYYPAPGHLRGAGGKRARAAHRQRGRGGPQRRDVGQKVPGAAAPGSLDPVHLIWRHRPDLPHLQSGGGPQPDLVLAGAHRRAHRGQPDPAAGAGEAVPGGGYPGGLHPVAGAAAVGRPLTAARTGSPFPPCRAPCSAWPSPGDGR